MDIKINLPTQVNTAIGLLQDNGFEAFCVGGCVRDAVMGKVPYDYDITTSALPEETKAVFKNYRLIETGIKHGTVTVIINHMPLEITTYRIDGEYKDNRHPESVNFSRNLRDDLSRRDFTVNTLCYNEKDGIVDLFGGIDDIQKKIIRCVGEPDKRFQEDALRIMRAVRFSCTLGFEIEKKTAESVLRNKELLKNISVERFRDELIKLVLSDRIYDCLKEFYPVIAVVIPEYSAVFGCEQNTPYHKYDVAEHMLKATENIEKDKILRLTMFFHDIAKPLVKKTDANGQDHFKTHAPVGAETVKEILKRLRFDNKTVNTVSKLILIHQDPTPKNKIEAKKFLNRIGEEAYIQFMKIRKADCSAKAQPHSADEKLRNMQLFLDEIKENNECYSLKQLSINGNDLKELGIKNGEEIHKKLDFLLNAVIEEKCDNTKKDLIEYFKKA